MEILVGKNSGFCAGVKHTISKTEEALKENNGEIYCLGELIHNKQVVQDLEKKGLKCIDSPQEAKDKLIIRAHGTTKGVYDFALKNNIKLLDLTCPRVLRIHDLVQDFSKRNYFVFLFGIKNHPETLRNF